MAASACHDSTAPGVPGCFAPAPLTGAPGSGDSRFIVIYRDGVDPVAETKRLSEKYDFTPSSVFTVLSGFAAQLPPAVVLAMRCEPSVRSIEYDQIAYIA